MDERFVHAVCNGVLIDVSQAVLPIARTEVQYGFGVYESLRVIGSHVVYLRDHLVRLMNSARGVGLEHQYSLDMVGAWVHMLVASDRIFDATIRILLIGGPDPLLFITASPLLAYPEQWYHCGVPVSTFSGERFMPKCKTNSLLLNYIALRDARQQGSFEALLVDRNGKALEGTRSNVFAVSGNTVFTAADDLVLEGVTRDKIVKATRQMGISVCFEAPYLKDLLDLTFDEIFISSTSMGALPVSSIDGVGCGTSFPVAAGIHALIRSWEAEELH